MSNANAFVAQEYDDSLQYSVRIAGFDLLAVRVDFAYTTLPYLHHDNSKGHRRSFTRSGGWEFPHNSEQSCRRGAKKTRGRGP
jgi:hypothetical protein